MRMTSLSVSNYRTLEDVKVTFPAFYTSICGKNDSGKTNLVKVLRGILEVEEQFFPYQSDITLENDLTRWLPKDPKGREIHCSLELEVSRTYDAGLFSFLERQLSYTPPATSDSILLSLRLAYSAKSPLAAVELNVDTKTYPPDVAHEVYEKLQSSKVFLFHNSTELLPVPFRRSSVGELFKELASKYGKELDELRQQVTRKFKKFGKEHQRQLNDLLGRLESRYKAGLTVPTGFDFSYLPYNMTLGKGKVEVSLDEWGSGTVNRTMILLTLLRAKEVTQSQGSKPKVTPVLFIEEPESFLHPSAQAEFGRILQNLAEEFKVQVISTTHSPYMLSFSNPRSNILFERKTARGELRGTTVVDTTGQNWMVPFGQALGLNSSDFEPWRNIFFTKDTALLLVEGDTDKEYFELLRSTDHGGKRLSFEGEIYAYEGKDNLKNTPLLKFIKARSSKLFITFDLDAREELCPNLQAMGLVEKTDFAALGVNAPGKKNIEGLLPDATKNAVRTNNPQLVDQAMSTDRDEARNARNRLKRLYLEEFRKTAQCSDLYYGAFYPLAKQIDKALI